LGIWNGEAQSALSPAAVINSHCAPVSKKPTQWEVYRPIKGSPGAFIGIVEAPDETSALKTAIEEFGIINPEHQNRVFVRRVPGDDELDR
jgi:hypothetical protein